MLQSIKNRVKAIAERHRVDRSISHVSGPRSITLSDDQVALILVGKNVEYFLPHFFEHHEAMGIDYFMYMDNGSDDRSVDIAAGFPNTIVATCSAAFSNAEHLIRFFACTRFLNGGWRLVVDADELFEFPGAAGLGGLPVLIKVMNTRGHTGLVAQMLDLAPAGALSHLASKDYPEAIRLCRNYSLNDINSLRYYSEETGWSGYMRKNKLQWDGVRVQFGGLRKTLFGEDCCLTKHPMFKMGRGVVPQPHPHVSTGLHITDFTALLKHYKFAGDFLARERSFLEGNRGADWEIRLRLDALGKDPEMSFLVAASKFDPSMDDLLGAEFLVASKSARRYLGIH